MRNTQRIVLVAALFFFMQSLHAQVSNADTMIHRVFATLKAKDEKAYVALYPNPEQFGRFMRNLMEQTLKSAEMKQLMAMDEKSKNMNVDSLIDAQVKASTTPEVFGQMEKTFGEMFRKTIEKGEKKGVRWNDARLVSYTVDSTADIAEGAPFQPQGIKAMKGVIDFIVGEAPYQLAFDKVVFIQSEGGWFGGEFTQLARKGESLAPDKENNNRGETGKPAAQQKKSAAKGKAPAAKSGTKTSARKKA